jgi:hypothetical protein
MPPSVAAALPRIASPCELDLQRPSGKFGYEAGGIIFAEIALTIRSWRCGRYPPSTLSYTRVGCHLQQHPGDSRRLRWRSPVTMSSRCSRDAADVPRSIADRAVLAVSRFSACGSSWKPCPRKPRRASSRYRLRLRALSGQLADRGQELHRHTVRVESSGWARHRDPAFWGHSWNSSSSIALLISS